MNTIPEQVIDGRRRRRMRSDDFKAKAVALPAGLGSFQLMRLKAFAALDVFINSSALTIDRQSDQKAT